MFNDFMTALASGDLNLVVSSTLGQIVISVLCVILLLLAVRQSSSRKFSTKILVFSATLMALAFVLGNIKLFKLPQGGSITLFRMLMIVLIGYFFGLKAGLMGAVAYGLLELVVDPYVVSPIQLLLDYPLAFGALGLSGLFKGRKNGLIFGLLVGASGRMFFNFLSGLIFFSQYTPEGWNPVIYSLWYNFSYIGVEAILSAIILMLPMVSSAIEQVRKSIVKTIY